MADFSLVPELRQLVDVLMSAPNCKVGDVLPISIRKRYTYSQTIAIFPKNGYDFFMSTEIRDIQTIAEIYKCELFISAVGNTPVIEITVWFL